MPFTVTRYLHLFLTLTFSPVSLSHLFLSATSHLATLFLSLTRFTNLMHLDLSSTLLHLPLLTFTTCPPSFLFLSLWPCLVDTPALIYLRWG